MEKKLKKILEQMIIDHKEILIEKYGEAAYKDLFTHRNKVSDEALNDDKIQIILEDLLDDSIDLYLTKKFLRKTK